MSYADNERFSEQDPYNRIFTDITASIEADNAEPNTDTLERFGNAVTELQQLAEPRLLDAIYVTYPIGRHGSALSVGCNRWNLQDTDAAKAGASLRLLGDDGKTISAVAGKQSLSTEQRDAFDKSIFLIADSLPTDKALWLERVYMLFSSGIVPDEDIDPDIMELFVDSPYEIEKFKEISMPVVRFANGTQINPAQWNYMTPGYNKDMPPHVEVESIRMYTPGGDCYTYSKTHDGTTRLTIVNQRDTAYVPLSSSDPRKILQAFRISQELGIGKLTDKNLTAFTKELETALAWGTVAA